MEETWGREWVRESEWRRRGGVGEGERVGERGGVGEGEQVEETWGREGEWVRESEWRRLGGERGSG